MLDDQQPSILLLLVHNPDANFIEVMTEPQGLSLIFPARVERLREVRWLRSHRGPWLY